MFKVDKVKPIDSSRSFPVATHILLASLEDSLPSPKNKLGELQQLEKMLLVTVTH